MTFNDILKESLLSIGGNKVRSFLTVLGIIIGVMAVVIMVAVGETVQKQITDQFSSLGTNTVMIRAGAAQIGGVRSGNRQTLTIDDADVIAPALDHGRRQDVIAPRRSGGAIIVHHDIAAKDRAMKTLDIIDKTVLPIVEFMVA